MKKILILIYFCTVQFTFAFSDTIILNLNSAINLAYENNAELKRQKIILDAAMRNIKNSCNFLIPSVSVAAVDNYVDPSEENGNSINVEGNISLTLKSSIISSVNKNKINYSLEKANFDIQANAIRNTVCESYFEILKVQQQIILKNENMKILKDLYEENLQKYKKGFLKEIEYLNSKILYEKSNSELLALQLEVKNLINNFKLILGLSVKDELDLDSNLYKLYEKYTDNFSEQYQLKLYELLNANEIPELKILGYKKQSLKKELQIKRFDAFGPDFNFSFQVSPILEQTEADTKIKKTFSAGISLPLENLISKSQGREEINIVHDQIKDLEIQIFSKKQEIENSIANLFLLVNQKTQTLKTAKNLIEVTKNNFDICKTSYSKGILDFQSLKNANTEYVDSQFEYSNMLLDILKTFSAIEQICGKTIGEE